MWGLTARCQLLALDLETCYWTPATRHDLANLATAFVADILAAARPAGQDSKHAGVAEHGMEEREMRLRALSTCLTPSRALFVHGLDAQQALLASIFWAQQAKKRAQALPRLLPAATQLFWEPETKLGVGYVFVGHDSNGESLADMLFLAVDAPKPFSKPGARARHAGLVW